MFISTFAKRVEIHCYDAHEVETEETIDGHVKVVAHDKLYNGDGHEFDVLIDDAFVPNVGVPLAKYVSRVRTLKRHFPTTEDGCDSVRFLHDMEHRLFFPPLPAPITICMCDRCKIEGIFHQDQRDTVLRLGDIIEPSPCRVIFPELKALSELWTQFRAVAHCEVVTPVEHRALIALQSFEPRVPEMSREDMKEPVVILGVDKDTSTFFGKSFVFHGVDPDTFPYVVSRANVTTRFATYQGLVDYAVLRDSLAYSFYRSSKFILTQSFIPEGWMKTGQTYNGWKELVRVPLQVALKVLSLPTLRRQHRGLAKAIPSAKLYCRNVWILNYDPKKGLEEYGLPSGQFHDFYYSDQPFCYWCKSVRCNADHKVFVDCGVCGPGFCVHRGDECDCGILQHKQRLPGCMIAHVYGLGVDIRPCKRYPHDGIVQLQSEFPLFDGERWRLCP